MPGSTEIPLTANHQNSNASLPAPQIHSSNFDIYQYVKSLPPDERNPQKNSAILEEYPSGHRKIAIFIFVIPRSRGGNRDAVVQKEKRKEFLQTKILNYENIKYKLNIKFILYKLFK
ncbi:unnamed protein product [Didymodactylos carnosus]|uniref:Uncharacterized protein n=1 Tax=Didymodactylos carnosus TaxID=1234261 RepID=A0A8S2E6M7_9BILA|nr:unnamed protein product [Didymodactylos carnosus]CAF3864366.1 unnamed protein product [Didymodactylos carnosus]